MGLNFTEFAERVFQLAPHALKNQQPVKPRYKGDHPYPETEWVPVKDVSEVTRTTRIEGEKVETGGTSGGNCWGDNPTAYSSDFEQPEIGCLDDLLAEVCPNITYLQYRKLIRDAKIQVLDWTKYEYYGNSTNYLQKVVTVGDLYTALLGLGVLGG